MQSDTWISDASLPVQLGNFPTRWPSASHTPTLTPSPQRDTMNHYPTPIIQPSVVMTSAPAPAPYSSRVCKDRPCILTVISSINVDDFTLKNHQYHTTTSFYTNTLVTTCVNCGYQTQIIHVDTTDDTDIPSRLTYGFVSDTSPIIVDKSTADSGGIEMASGGIGGRPAVPRQQSLGEPQSSTGQPCPNGVRSPYPEGLGNPMTYEGSRNPRVARVGTHIPRVSETRRISRGLDRIITLGSGYPPRRTPFTGRLSAQGPIRQEFRVRFPGPVPIHTHKMED